MKDSCIVVLYYNKTTHTKICLDSIINSGYAPGMILAFDNGSDIENHNIILQTCPEIKHNRIDENKGYSGGFNEAVKWAIAEGFKNILFCTNDTKVFPDTIDKCEYYSKKFNSSLIAPKIIYFKSQDIDSIGGSFDNEKFKLKHYKENNLPLELDPQSDYIPGTAFWLSDEVFKKLNGMDESYHTYWEDVDFSFRAHKQGIKMVRCYDAVISHSVGKTCHKKPLYSIYYYQRNRIKFCKKFCLKKELEKAKHIIYNELKAYELKYRIKKDIMHIKFIEDIYRELDS